MEFHIGAPIFDRDGDKVGQLKHVIVDPDTREIVEVVLGESGLLGREVLVPIEAVREAMHDRIQLELDKEQIKSLKDFVITRYVIPPSGTLADVPWAGGALYPQPIPLVGAATGIETIAATPLVEEIPQIPENDIDIRSGQPTVRWARSKT
jgi:sporulation protein YlmC with PRC-barrel domain